LHINRFVTARQVKNMNLLWIFNFQQWR